MWLVDVSSYRLVYFANPPEHYAILSHTWREDEVLFQDMQHMERATERKGWRKVQDTCDQARKNRYEHVWIDTCCIDKTSSAELSEAINSMFQWYARASCCYAYLDDYDATAGEAATQVTKESLRQCQWFYRGWTLQELIASPNLILYGKGTQGWVQLGTKETLQGTISHITGIDQDVLAVAEHMYAIPVARRMCWAAHRETSRAEDAAYCLVGLFGVSMPLMYGEGGERAFERLQREIARRHCDASLLAWTQEGDVPRYRGMLARSPAEFAFCSKMTARADGYFSRSRLVFTDSGELVMYQRGAEAARQTKRDRVSAAPEVHGMDLTQVFDFMGMDRGNNRESTRIGVLLQRFGDVYVRSRPNTLVSPARFTTRFESSSSSTCTPAPTRDLVAAATLSDAHAAFIDIMLQRRLFLLYRRKLIRNVIEFNRESPHPTLLNALGGRAREMLEANRIDASHCPVILREFRIGDDSGGEPIWWDSMVLMLGDGGSSVRVRLSVVCGIPARPDASSERVLPWFAIFCDRGACSGWGKSSDRNGEIGALVVSRLHSTDGRETQRYLSDVIFENYADATGSITQEKVPTVVMVRDKARTLHEIRVNRLGGGGGSTFSADVQYLARGAVESPTSPRRTFKSFRSGTEGYLSP